MQTYKKKEFLSLRTLNFIHFLSLEKDINTVPKILVDSIYIYIYM